MKKYLVSTTGFNNLQNDDNSFFYFTVLCYVISNNVSDNVNIYHLFSPRRVPRKS